MIHCTSCNLLAATPAVVTPARTLLDMWQFSSFKFPIFNSSVSAVSKILVSSPFLWSARKPAKPSYGGHGQSSSNKWQPDLHTSPIQDYNCQKCISEHRSVATPVTSSRWDYDNIAVASPKWDWSFRYESTVITVKLKWLNKARNRLRNPQLQTRKSWWRPIQDNPNQELCNDMTNTWQTVSAMTLLWTVRCFSASTQWYFPRLLFPVFFLLFFFFCLPLFLTFKHLAAQEIQWTEIQSNT